MAFGLNRSAGVFGAGAVVGVLLCLVVVLYLRADANVTDVDGVLWVQSSAEYRGAARTAYRLAEVMLERGLADPTWTASVEQQHGTFANLPPCVVVDIDDKWPKVLLRECRLFLGRLLVKIEPFQAQAFQEAQIKDAYEGVTWPLVREILALHTRRNDTLCGVCRYPGDGGWGPCR